MVRPILNRNSNTNLTQIIINEIRAYRETLIIIINQSATCFGRTGSLLLNKNIHANIQCRTISSILHVRFPISVSATSDMSDRKQSSSTHHDAHMSVQAIYPRSGLRIGGSVVAPASPCRSSLSPTAISSTRAVQWNIRTAFLLNPSCPSTAPEEIEIRFSM